MALPPSRYVKKMYQEQLNEKPLPHVIEKTERMLGSAVIFGSGIFAIACVYIYSRLSLGRFSPDDAPFEDAAMLFRYAEIFAQGGGIAYNYGEHPGVSDGATDLGFVLALAPLILLGIDSTVAAFILNSFGVVGVGFLFGTAFVVSKVSFTLRNLVFLGGAILSVMSGPVHNYLAAGFSPPIFGFLLATTGMLGFVLGKRTSNNAKLGITVGLVAALSGIWRPEGFFFGPFFAVIGYIIGAIVEGKLSWTKLARDLFPFVFPIFSVLATYLVYRYFNFGRVFPTSAVNKTDFQLNLFNAENSLAFLGTSTSLFIVLVLFAVTKLPSLAWPLVLALVVTTLFWIPFSLTLNWWMRFQWPLVPALAIIAFLAFLPTLRSNEHAGSGRWERVVASLGLSVLLVILAVASHEEMSRHHGSYFEAPYQLRVSEAIRPLETRDLRLATSEAGIIPLRFEGKVLDTYGHNHRQIAEDPGSLAMVMKEFAPDILILHGRNPGELSQEGCSALPRSGFEHDWLQMNRTLTAHAIEAKMKLFRVDQTGLCDSWIIYLGERVPVEVQNSLRSFPAVGEITWLDQPHNRTAGTYGR